MYRLCRKLKTPVGSRFWPNGLEGGVLLRLDVIHFSPVRYAAQVAESLVYLGKPGVRSVVVAEKADAERGRGLEAQVAQQAALPPFGKANLDGRGHEDALLCDDLDAFIECVYRLPGISEISGEVLRSGAVPELRTQ